MGPWASRSSILRGFLDGVDALDGMDVAKVLPRSRGSLGRIRARRAGDGRVELSIWGGVYRAQRRCSGRELAIGG
jgi:hypothetical protein